MGQQALVGHAKMLRAWQLAILRFALTLDSADKLAVLAIANEIDRLGRRNEQASGFSFFRRSSAELCAAILRQHQGSDAILQKYLERIDDAQVKRAFAAAIAIDQPIPISVKQRTKPDNDLWRGLPSRGGIPD